MEQKISMIGRYTNINTATGTSVAMGAHKQQSKTGLSNNSQSPHKRHQYGGVAITTAQNFRTVLDTASNQHGQNMMASSASKSSSCYTPFKTSTSGFKSKQRLQSSAGTAHHHFDSSSIDSPAKVFTTNTHNSNKSAVKKKVLPPRVIEVETLFIGGGPATLGVLANAYQTQRLDDLVLGSSAQNISAIAGNRAQSKGAGNQSSNDYNNNIVNSTLTGMGSLNSLSMALNSKVTPTTKIKSGGGSTIHDVGYHLSNGLLQGRSQLAQPPSTFNNDQQQSQKCGLAIIDISDQFGGGNLQRHYGIKSNTSASGFLKVLMYSKPYTAPVPAQNQAKTFNGTSTTSHLQNKNSLSQPPCGRTSNLNILGTATTGTAQGGARKISSHGYRPNTNISNNANLGQLQGNQIVDPIVIGSQQSAAYHAKNNVSHFQALTKVNGVGQPLSTMNSGFFVTQQSQNRLKNNNNGSQLSHNAHKVGQKQQASKSITNPLYVNHPQSLMANTVGPSIFKGLKQGQNVMLTSSGPNDGNGGGTNGGTQRSKSEYEKHQDLAKQFMPPFVDFACTNDIALSLQRYGKKIAPLQLIGTFLSYAGNAMLNDIWHRYQKKVFYGNSQAVKIFQVQESISGNTSTYQWMTEVQTTQNGNQMTTQQTFFKSKNIVFACGAEQMLPHSASLRSLYNLKSSCRIFTSDQVLKQDGFQQLVQAIRQQQGKCKIRILGGSHSAFSVLYLLLNGPCKIKVFDDFKRNNHTKVQQQTKSSQKKGASGDKSGSQGSPLLDGRSGTQASKFSPTKGHHGKSSGKIKDILHESQKHLNSAGKTSYQNHYEQMHLGPRGYQINFCYNCYCCGLGQSHSKMKVCPCGAPCQCLSNPQIPASPRRHSSLMSTPGKKQSQLSSPDKKSIGGFDTKQQVLVGEDHVSIVYRNQIKVHFSTVEYATQENYTSYDKKLDLSQGGIVYPFTGIRGDAKEIWFRVNKGQEPHASFVQADSMDEQRQVLRDADIVIFACGYQSRQVPIFDCHGNQIQLSSNLFMSQNAMQIAKQQHLQRQHQSSTSKSMLNQSTNQQAVSGLKHNTTGGSIGQTLVVNKIVKPQLQSLPQGGSQLTVNGSHHTQTKSEMQREYIDVNQFCQLLDARRNNAPIPGLFGIGQGYSLSTSDNSVQAELRPGGKADSVGLYIKQIGNKILSQLFPQKKIVYLQPPKIVPVAGINLQGYSGTSQAIPPTNSQVSRVREPQNQQNPSQEQINVGMGGITQINPLTNPKGQQFSNQQFILAANNPTSESVNQQLSLNNTVTVGNFQEKSRTTSSKLYSHPKTQEHHSSKFQSFQQNDRQTSFVPQSIAGAIPPNTSSQYQYMQFSSVFSKSVGKSSLNVSQVASKSYNGHIYSGVLHNPNTNSQPPLTTSNAITNMSKKYTNGVNCDISNTFEPSTNTKVSKSYINNEKNQKQQEYNNESFTSAGNQFNRWPIVSSRQSQSNQGGFMSITEYLGSRKMVSGPLNTQGVPSSQQKYQYQAHHSAHSQHLAASESSKINYQKGNGSQNNTMGVFIDERSFSKNPQTQKYTSSDPQRLILQHQNRQEDKNLFVTTKHRQQVANGLTALQVAKQEHQSIPTSSISYPQKEDPSLDSIDLATQGAQSKQSGFRTKRKQHTTTKTQKKMPSQMLVDEQQEVMGSCQDNAREGLGHQQVIMQQQLMAGQLCEGFGTAGEKSVSLSQSLVEKLINGQGSQDEALRNQKTASPGGFHRKKSPIMSASYVNQQSPVQVSQNQKQSQIEMRQGEKTMIIIQDQQQVSPRQITDLQQKRDVSDDISHQMLPVSNQNRNTNQLNEYNSSFYQQNLAQKMALSANVSFDNQIIQEQKKGFDAKHQSTATSLIPRTRNDTVQHTSITQNIFTDGGIIQHVPLQKYQHDAMLSSTWRQRQGQNVVQSIDNGIDTSDKLLMQSGAFSAAQSYIHHPSGVAYPADQSISSHLNKTSFQNFNKHFKTGESAGITSHGPQLIPSPGIDFILNDGASQNTKQIEPVSPHMSKVNTFTDQQPIFQDIPPYTQAQAKVIKRERNLSPAAIHSSNQQHYLHDALQPNIQGISQTFTSLDSPKPSKQVHVAHQNPPASTSLPQQFKATTITQKPTSLAKTNLPKTTTESLKFQQASSPHLSNPCGAIGSPADSKGRYDNFGSQVGNSPNKHRNTVSMHGEQVAGVVGFGEERPLRDEVGVDQYYGAGKRSFVSQGVEKVGGSSVDRDFVQQQSFHRVTKSNNFQGQGIPKQSHANEKQIQFYIANNKGTSDLSSTKIDNPQKISGAPSSIPSQMLQNKQMNLQVYPTSINGGISGSSGHQKNRGGLSGAAGSIMAANIANMGYLYPNQTQQGSGGSIHQTNTTSIAPSSELIPINSGCVAELQKIKAGQGAVTNLGKENGMAFLPLKPNKTTTSDILSNFMAPPKVNVMSDNYRHSPQMYNYSGKQQTLKKQKRQHHRQFQNTAEPLILNNSSVSRGSRRVALISAHQPASQNSHYPNFNPAMPTNIQHNPTVSHRPDPTISRSSNTNDYLVQNREHNIVAQSTKPVSSCISAKTTQHRQQNHLGPGPGLHGGSSQGAFQQTSSQAGLQKNQSHIHVKKQSIKTQEGGVVAGSHQQQLQTRGMSGYGTATKAGAAASEVGVTNDIVLKLPLNDAFQQPTFTVLPKETQQIQQTNIQGPVFVKKQTTMS